MEIGGLYREIRRELAAVSEDAALEAGELCHSVCGGSKAACLAGGAPIGESDAARLRQLVRRRLAGEPLQYLLGEWDFFGRTFAVGPGALIPRADTETLLEHALTWARGQADAALQIADLCAGSGCLAVTLALELPGASVTAVEKSPDALRWLRQNIRRHGVAVTVTEDDVLEPDGDYPAFDLIVSNPPYLSAVDLAALQREVSFEPRMALDGGGDGLDFYRILPAVWKKRMKPGGMLAVEVGAGQAEAVVNLLKNNCFKRICVQRDICGIIRVVSGTAPTHAGQTVRRTGEARSNHRRNGDKRNGTAESEGQAAGGANGIRRGQEKGPGNRDQPD